LIHKALEISDQGCQTVGRNQVCYGHNTVEAQLVPGANARFDRPGSTIPIDILESFIAFPYDPQKGDWGVGVFRLEANLPGTLPGQLVTMLVFGNTTLQNVSGNMQAFYFSSGLGGIKCDAVPFDGILVRMAEGAGFSFQVNGAAVTLQGNSILQATANDDLAVTTLSGTGKVSSLGEEQSLDTGQTVTVPLGGEDGMNAEGPPTSPQPADATMLESTNCTLASEGCSEQPSPSPLAEAEDKTSLETDKEATTAGSLDDAKDDEELSKDKTTPTPPSLKKTERVKVTLVPVSTVASKPTEILKPTNTPEPITDTKPTEIPEPTEPIDIPKPTNVPKPTDEVKPVDEVEPTKEG
jgi:hypothetical protein